MLLRFGGGLVHKNWVQHTGLPEAQGLYDPAYEHDACGVGFVAHVKGQPLARHRPAGAAGPHQPGASRRVRLRGEHRRRRRHPASRCPTGSSAAKRPPRLDLPPAGALRRRPGVPPREPTARRSQGAVRADRPRGGAAGARLARRADRDSALGASARRRRAGRSSMFVGRGEAATPGRRRATPLRAEAVRHPQARRARRSTRCLPRSASASTSSSLSSRTLIYKGMLDAEPDRGHVPRPGRSGDGVGARARAPALQHEHVPVVAARAPVPLHRAQRRDQHAARQHQLDEGARGAARVATCFGDDLHEDPADHPRGRQRHARSSTTCSSCSSWPAARCRTRC